MANFHEVLRSIGDKLFVVDFFATWFGPYKQLAPKFGALIPKHLDVMFRGFVGLLISETKQR